MTSQNQLVIKSFLTRDVQPVANLHPETLIALDLVEGDYLFVKGKKKSETVLTVYEDASTPLGNHIHSLLYCIKFVKYGWRQGDCGTLS
jgi:hypothetical protein